MSYDYRIPQGRDKGKRTNGMFSLGGKLGSVLSALGNGEKLMQVRLWQNWEMVMGPDIAPLAWPLGARNDILIIGGEDNLALQELSFMTPEILERVNAFMDAPVFDRVELRLVMGDRPLDQMPDIQPSTRVRPAPPRPRQLGAHLEEMNPDSPVARCHAAYLRMHGAEKLKGRIWFLPFFVIALQIFLVFPTFESAFAAPSILSPKAEVKVGFRILNIKIQLFL